MNQQIQEFNQQLIDDEIELTIIDYVKKLNEQFYDIDISFIDEFIDLVDKDDFVIHHKLLKKYNVLNEDSDISHVLRLFKQYDLEEDQDFAPLLGGFDDNASVKMKKTYYMSNNTFKLILMRNKNTRKYAQYFILLEKAIKYYNQNQIQKLNKKLQSICEDRVLKYIKKRRSICYPKK